MHLKLPTDAATFRLPVNTLIFRAEGLRVAIVKDGRVALLPITLGRDFGSTVEVLSGLTGDEAVVVNPPDSLTAGQVGARGRAGADDGAAAVKRAGAACLVAAACSRPACAAAVRRTTPPAPTAGCRRRSRRTPTGRRRSRPTRRCAASGGRSSAIRS